jgi:hypothetical protein
MLDDIYIYHQWDLIFHPTPGHQMLKAGPVYVKLWGQWRSDHAHGLPYRQKSTIFHENQQNQSKPLFRFIKNRPFDLKYLKIWNFLKKNKKPSDKLKISIDLSLFIQNLNFEWKIDQKPINRPENPSSVLRKSSGFNFFLKFQKLNFVSKTD